MADDNCGHAARGRDSLVRLFRTKKLCLIRRYIGKFLAEKELHEKGNIKDPEPYCRNLNRATGFVYEPRGYLIDMEPDFYALDYLSAWLLQTCCGLSWKSASARNGSVVRMRERS